MYHRQNKNLICVRYDLSLSSLIHNAGNMFKLIIICSQSESNATSGLYTTITPVTLKNKKLIVKATSKSVLSIYKLASISGIICIDYLRNKLVFHSLNELLNIYSNLHFSI